MFKSIKKKVGIGRERVDFKLEFHASQIPLSGWERLLVLLISLETGKITVKTAKASVQNGTCEWKDPVYESSRILLDGRVKGTDKALYRIVVSTGSSRSGVLGETIVNFADHIGTNKPVSLSLPLQNCNAGAILHVKLQCLAPKYESRDLGDNREVVFEPSIQSSESNEHAMFLPDLCGNRECFFPPQNIHSSLDSLESSLKHGGDVTNGNIEGISDRDMLLSFGSMSISNVKQEKIGDLDGINVISRTAESQDSSSTVPSPSVDANPMKSGNDSTSLPSHPLKPDLSPCAGEIDTFNPAGVLKWNSQGNSFKGNLPLVEKCISRSRRINHQRSSSMGTDIEATEMLFEDFQNEIASWDWNPWMVAEIEKLKKQLDVEKRNSIQMNKALSALSAEHDSLRLESELLRSRKQAFEETEAVWDKLWLEVEDARSAIKELQDGLAYEKSMNFNLNVQLQKTQDSNSELLLEIQELEESLRKKSKEEHKVEACKIGDNQEHILVEAKVPWMQELVASEEEVKRLEEKIEILEASEREGVTINTELQSTINGLKMKLNELERNVHELTEEKLDLMSQLKQENGKLSLKDYSIGQIKSKIKMLTGFSLNLASDSDVGTDQLVAMVNDLKQKLEFFEESLCCQSCSSETQFGNLDCCDMDLYSKNADLELQLKHSEEKFNSLVQQLDAMKEDIANHDKEKSLFASQKGQLKILRDKVSKVEQDLRSSLKQAEDLEAMNTKLKEETGKTISTLEQQLKITEEKMSLLDEQRTNACMMLADLQVENAKLSEQLTALLIVKEASEINAIDLKKLNMELQEKLQQAELNCTKAFSQVQEHETEITKFLKLLTATESQVKDAENKLLELEEIREKLEIKMQVKEEEDKMNKDHLKELESQILSLDENIRFLNESKSMLEIVTQDLQLQNDVLRNKLQVAVGECVMVDEHANALLQEVGVLKAVVDFYMEKGLSMVNEVLSLEALKEFHQAQAGNMSVKNRTLERVNELEAQYDILSEEKEVLKVCAEELEFGRGVCGISPELENRKGLPEISLPTGVERFQKRSFDSQSELVAVDKVSCRGIVWCHDKCIDSMARNEVATKELLEPGQKKALQNVMEGQFTSSVRLALPIDELVSIENMAGEMEIKSSDEPLCLILSQEEYNMTDDRSQEMAWRNWAHSATMEHSQQDIQLEINVPPDYCEKDIGNQDLSAYYQFQTKKAQLSRTLLHMKEVIVQVNANLSALIEKLELRAKKAKGKQQKLAKFLEETIRELDFTKRAEMDHEQKVAELEWKCKVLEDEKNNLAEEVDECRNKIQDYEALQNQLADNRNALHNTSLEKLKIEESLQKISLDNSKLIEEVTSLKQKAVISEEGAGKLKQSKLTVEHKIEMVKLRRQAAELKHKLSEQEERGGELKKKVSFLEEELRRKVASLAAAEKKLKGRDRGENMKASNGATHVSVPAKSIMKTNNKILYSTNISPSSDRVKKSGLHGKIKFLEDGVKTKAMELESSKKEFKEKETELCNVIEHLKLVNEHLVEEQNDPKADKLWEEEKQLLQSKLSMLNESAEGMCLERAISIETETSTPLVADDIYEKQLQCAFTMQQIAHATACENLECADQVIQNLTDMKRKNSCLEEELREMQERFSLMSLQFAELESEREDLVMTIKTLRSSPKLTNSKSYS